jgi:hypothetical protein
VGYQSNLRVQQFESQAIYRGNAVYKKIFYQYIQQNGMWLPSTVDEINYLTGQVYRRTETTYTSYPAQYILGLPQQGRFTPERDRLCFRESATATTRPATSPIPMARARHISSTRPATE